MYVEITVFYLVVKCIDVDAAPLPLRITIDCGIYDEDSTLQVGISRIHKTEAFEADKFCKQIIDLIPKALEKGKFIIMKRGADQELQGDTMAPTILAAPNFKRRIPDFMQTPTQLKISRIKVPKLNVPQLKINNEVVLPAPKIGKARIVPVLRQSRNEGDSEEESSAERIEKFKKGIRKMLRVVKIMSQVDQYLTERMRLFIDRLATTFAI